MLSKRSSFNATLFRKNLTRFWPLWGGASLLGSLLPLYLLMTLLSPYGAHVTQRDIVIALYSVSTVALPAITLVYAVLVAMTIWNYLYSARSVGLMHTLPIDRRGLFLTNVLSGFAMLLLPYAIAGGLGIVITLLFGIFPGLAVLQTVAAVVGLSAFYFGTATFCAMITGHLIALPVFYFIGHFLAVALEFLVATFSTNFIFGYTGPSSLSLDFLSPTVYIYRRLCRGATPSRGCGWWGSTPWWASPCCWPPTPSIGSAAASAPGTWWPTAASSPSSATAWPSAPP